MGAVVGTSFSGGGTSGTTDRSATGTPVVGDIWLVICNVTANGNLTPTCSDTGEGGLYARIGAALFASVNTLSAFVRCAPFISTASATVTVATGSNSAGNVIVIPVSGMTRAGAAAIRAFAVQSNQAGATTPAPTLAQAALLTNMVISAVGNNTNPAGVTAPTSFTQQQNVGQPTPNVGLTAASVNSGFTGTTVTWGSTSASTFASIVFELDTTYDPIVAALAGNLIGPYYGPSSLLYSAGGIWTPTVGFSTLLPTSTIPTASTLRNGTLLLAFDGVAKQLTTTGNNTGLSKQTELAAWPAVANRERMVFSAYLTSAAVVQYITRWNNTELQFTAGDSFKLHATGPNPNTDAVSNAVQNTGIMTTVTARMNDASGTVTMAINGVDQTTTGNFSSNKDWGSAADWGASGMTYGSNNGANFFTGTLALHGYVVTPASSTFSAATRAALQAAMVALLNPPSYDPFGRMGIFGF